MFSRVSSRVLNGMRASATKARSTFTNTMGATRKFTGFSGASASTASVGSLYRLLPLLVGGAAVAVAATSGVTSNHVECAGRLPPEGLPGTNQERTFIAIKPDGVQRQLIGKIIQRFEEKGFTLVAMKLVHPSLSHAQGHYDDLKNKPFFPKLVKFFSSGPVVAMVWQGKGVILTGRKLLGETDPAKSPPGSIRGDYSIDIGRNIIHGSDSAEGAQHEIGYWFKPEEIFEWTPEQNKWIYE